MRISLKNGSILAAVFVLIFGCTGALKKPAMRIDYYSLDYDPPGPAALSPLDAVVGVQRFQVAPIYNSNKIIYRDKQFKRNAYTYHKWRANPGDLVSYFLARDLGESAVFKAVFTLDKKLPVSHTLEGRVDEFFEFDRDNLWEAVLSVSVTLLKENEPDISKRVLMQKKYRVRKPCRQKTPQALAEAMSHAMAAVSKNINDDLYLLLAEEYKAAN